MGSKCACNSYGSPSFSISAHRTPGLASPGFAALVSNSYGVPGIGVAKAHYNYRPRRGYGYGVPGIAVNARSYGEADIDAQIQAVKDQIEQAEEEYFPARVEYLKKQLEALEAQKAAKGKVDFSEVGQAVAEFFSAFGRKQDTTGTSSAPPPPATPSWVGPAAAAAGVAAVLGIGYLVLKR